MDKGDLISAVAKDLDVTLGGANKAIASVIDNITKVLASGESLQFTGFGTFKVNDRKATTGRNPRTGEAIDIPARKVPAFSAGKTLKDAVNK